MAPPAGILGAVLLLVQSLAGPGAIERTSSWIDTDSDDTGLPPMPHAPPEDDPSRDARDAEDSDGSRTRSLRHSGPTSWRRPSTS